MRLMLPRTRLIWIVAGLSALEALGESIVAALDADVPKVGVCGVIVIVVFVAAGYVENVKTRGGD